MIFIKAVPLERIAAEAPACRMMLCWAPELLQGHMPTAAQWSGPRVVLELGMHLSSSSATTCNPCLLTPLLIVTCIIAGSATVVD